MYTLRSIKEPFLGSERSYLFFSDTHTHTYTNETLERIKDIKTRETHMYAFILYFYQIKLSYFTFLS